MTALPQIEETTIRQILAAWEGASESWDSIGISMSALGGDCDREIWNSFRWVSPQEKHDGQRLRLFETGNIEEDRMIADLRRIPGVTVFDTDPDRVGKQWKVFSHGGHVRGKLDGKVIGLPEAPTTLHVLECKSHNDKNFKLLVKNKLREAKPAHWYQCQEYMGATKLDRCLYLAVNKNNDELYAERIEFDAKAFDAMQARLEKIINAAHAPSRVSANPDKWPCMLCKHADVCHSKTFARRNCRTCVHATPVIIEGETTAKWKCEKFNKWLPVERQKLGCDSHLYHPDLVPGKQIDVGPDWIAYEMPNGERWVDSPESGKSSPCEVCGDSKVEQISAGHGVVLELPCSLCSPTKCEVCGESQIYTQSGTTCKNGHGGAGEATFRYWWREEDQQLERTLVVQPDGIGWEELTVEDYAQAQAFYAEASNAR